MAIKVEENRAQPRRSESDRRAGDRRASSDRRQVVVEVPVERRVEGRRFVERRAEVRRRLNDRLLT